MPTERAEPGPPCPRVHPTIAQPAKRRSDSRQTTGSIPKTQGRRKHEAEASATRGSKPRGVRRPVLYRRPELVARLQLKQVVTNRVSQVFTADSFKVEGKDPLVIRVLYAQRRDAMMLDPTPLIS